MPIYQTSGDIFEIDANVLINPVNCKGVMGGGLALDFKNAYPEMFREYEKVCRKGMLKVGMIWVYDIGDKHILCLPTKDHYKNPSEIEYVESGLIALRKWLLNQSDYNRLYVAMPKIGCGLGGLEWEDVRPLIVKHLDDLACVVYILDNDTPSHSILGQTTINDSCPTNSSTSTK